MVDTQQTHNPHHVTHEVSYLSPKGLQINCVRLEPSKTVALQFITEPTHGGCIHTEHSRVNEAHIALTAETALAIAYTILTLLDNGFGIKADKMPIPSGKFSTYEKPDGAVIFSDGGDEVSSILEYQK